jgi:hypothetical protein
MIARSNVGELGVTSTMAGPKRIVSSMMLPLLSLVKKTFLVR